MVAQRVGLAGEVDDDWHHEVWLDGVEEARVGFEVRSIADGLEHHAGVSEGENAVGEDAVVCSFDGDDVGESDGPGFGGCVVSRVRLTEEAG